MAVLTADMANAVINGDLSKVKELFKDAEDVLTTDSENQTPIILAVHNEHIDILEYLLNLAGNIDLAESHGMTALHTACMCSKLDVVEWLLEKGANPDAEFILAEPTTPLYLTFSMVDDSVKPDLIKLLLKHGADPDKRSVLSMFFAQGDVESVKIFIEHGIDLYKYNNISGESPLYVAMRAWNQNVIRHLMELGIDFKDYKKLGFDCFLVACSTGKKECVEFIWETIYNKELPEDVKNKYMYTLGMSVDLYFFKFLVEKVGCSIEARNGYDETPFLLAIENHDSSIEQYLISIGADLKAKRFDGKTALHMFCLNASPYEDIFLSILASSEVNAVDSKRRTPLHCAAMYGANDIIKRLAKSGADRNARDIHNATPLHYLSGVKELQWNEEVFEYFVDDFDLDTIDDKGRAPYHIAAENAPFQFFEELFGRGANINRESDDKGTALHHALAGNRWSNAKLLIELGSNVNTPNKDGQTPLHLCVRSIKILETLLDKGANLHATDKSGQTVLHLVCEATAEYCEEGKDSRADVASFLLERGSDVNAADNFGRKPLHIAYQNGNLEVVEILLAHGAEKNAVDNEGRNILHYALQADEVDIESIFDDSLNVADKNGHRPIFYAHQLPAFEFLLERSNNITSNDLSGIFPNNNCLPLPGLKIILERGVPANASDENGTTLLHFYALGGFAEEVMYLLERGADVNARNKKLLTPLHYAATISMYNVETAEILIEHGADIEALSDENQTPLDLARLKERNRRDWKMVNYLASKLKCW